MNETLDAFAQLTDLEEMEQLEKRLSRFVTPLVTTDQIAMLASRKPLSAENEVERIAHALKTKCHCHHLAGHVIGGICYFGRCHHAIHVHQEKTS